MMRHRSSISTVICILAALSMYLATAHPVQSRQPMPKIAITVLPPYDEKGGPNRMKDIEGTASVPGDCQDCRVVLFARTDTWYVQPYIRSPYTKIDKSHWKNGTHLGTDYAALLVRSSYKPPATTDKLPDVGGDVIALDEQVGKK